MLEPSVKDQDHSFQKSALYQEFLAEREEILRHKWIESEKQGQDIGFEKALLDWKFKHCAAWRAQRHQRMPAFANSSSNQRVNNVTTG